MVKLTRKNQKVFAGNANNNGVFGSLQSGNKQLSNDPEVIQSLPAYSAGWNDATISSEDLPALEEFQGIQYVVTRQLAYIYETGTPEYDANTNYCLGAECKVIGNEGNYQIFSSVVADNINHPVTDTAYWKEVFNTEFSFVTEQIMENYVENYVTDFTDKNVILYNRLRYGISAAPNGVFSLEDLTITIKSGLEVIIPNGRNADNTYNSLRYTFSNDVSADNNTAANICYVFAGVENNSPLAYIGTYLGAYTSSPTTSIQYSTYLNLIENKFYRYIETSWVPVLVSIVGSIKAGSTYELVGIKDVTALATEDNMVGPPDFSKGITVNIGYITTENCWVYVGGNTGGTTIVNIVANFQNADATLTISLGGIARWTYGYWAFLPPNFKYTSRENANLRIFPMLRM